MTKLIASKKYKYIYTYRNTKNEEKWKIRWTYYDIYGKRKELSREGLSSENEAYKLLLEAQSMVQQGQSKMIDYDNMKVSTWMQLWYDSHSEWSESTKRQREMAIRLQINPLIGDYKLSKLDKITYKQVFINKLLEDYKPSTVRLLHSLFKIAVNEAVEDEIISRNRFGRIKIPKPNKKVKHLTAAELSTFISTAKRVENLTNYVCVLVLAYSGMRRGELLGLQWENIDFTNNQITINSTRDNKGNRKPKTDNSYRTVLMDSQIMNELKKYKLWSQKKHLSFGLKFKESNFVFISDQKGTPLADNTLSYSFRRIVEHCDLDNVHPHMMRHTHATLLLESNNRPSINSVAERLGCTPEMIMNVYAHVLESMHQELVSAFSSSIAL